MNAPNVLAGSRLITKRLVKLRVAAAIAAAQDRNGWSDDCAGAALGVCGTTIANRKDVDDPGKQMTVFELLRSVPNDPAIANDILALVGVKMVELDPAEGSGREACTKLTRLILEMSVALEDGKIDDRELVAMRGALDEAGRAIDAMRERLGPKGARA